MHQIVYQWLHGPARDNKTRIQYLAELISVNHGTMNITIYGIVTPSDSVWKRVGLTFQEAIDLASLKACIEGMALGANDKKILEQVHEIIQREISMREQRTSIILPTEDELKKFGFQL